jgi:hypothetical protein
LLLKLLMDREARRRTAGGPQAIEPHQIETMPHQTGTATTTNPPPKAAQGHPHPAPAPPEAAPRPTPGTLGEGFGEGGRPPGYGGEPAAKMRNNTLSDFFANYFRDLLAFLEITLRFTKELFMGFPSL